MGYIIAEHQSATQENLFLFGYRQCQSHAFNKLLLLHKQDVREAYA